MQLVFALILALVTPAPTGAPAPTPSSSTTSSAPADGVSLGETATQLVAERGEPMFVTERSQLAQWVYLSPHGQYVEIVGIQRGYVTVNSFLARRTELPTMVDDIAFAGTRIGDPASAAPKGSLNGSVDIDNVRYWFRSKDGTTIDSMGEALTDDAAVKLPTLSEIPLLHNGSSFSDAVVIRASSDFLGIRYEDAYMAGHFSCKPGKLKKLKQSLVHKDGKNYDLMETGCDNSGDTHTFYFDITDPMSKI